MCVKYSIFVLDDDNMIDFVDFWAKESQNVFLLSHIKNCYKTNLRSCQIEFKSIESFLFSMTSDQHWLYNILSLPDNEDMIPFIYE